MKKQHCLVIITAIIGMLVSCGKSTDTSMIERPIDSDNGIIISEESYMHDTQASSTQGDVGKYAEFFSQPDATIGISSSRYYPLGEETVMAFYDPAEQNATKAVNDDYAQSIRINGMNLFSPGTKSGDGSVVGMFGKTVSFDLSGFGPATKAGDNIELYAPEIVRIQFPTIVSEEHRYPLCYYKNFVVKWNPDPSNENGIIVLVKWDGSMVFGEDYTSSYVYHTVCVPDTGSVELSESMFEDIPDAAFCNLYLFRGDIENVEIDETRIRLLAESHDVLDFVLIRNLE